MRRLAFCLLVAFALAMPAVASAQRGPYNDKQNPNEYTDAEDGQPLKFFSYFIAPIGYAFEWGVMRPMHYLATKTALAPVMSGDTERSEIYNPGPSVEPIQPLPPANVAPPIASAAPQTLIERAPPATAPQPVTPAQVAPSAPSGEQPALH